MDIEADLCQIEAEEIDIDRLAAKLAPNLRVLDTIGYLLPVLSKGMATENTEDTEAQDKVAKSIGVFHW
jgi:hypothetical protein